MPDATMHVRSEDWRAQQPAGDKTSLSPETLCSHGDGAGHCVLVVRSFVENSRSRCRKAVSALLAVLALLLLSTCSQESWFLSRIPAQSYVSRCLRRVDAIAASPFLEVLQAYPPVLTVVPNGTLELTDGSPNATIRLIDNQEPTYQELVAEHSFGLSYGHPFVGDYAPPECAFNRVTWNLTVVSAGRQFDRLGIVYLGDVEVFRTSTAEPTANGITWTYLKVSTIFHCALAAHTKLTSST